MAAAVAAVLLALVLSGWEPAAADDGESVTNVLQPGFNLAGWVEPEAGVGELFATLPQLEAIYAWDAEAESFWTASADGGGDLTTLKPGMGLWLHIAGTNTVDWTRPAAADPSAGLVSLQEGWNLIAWAGHAGAGLGEAVAGLGSDAEAAVTWDAQGQRFRYYAPGAEELIGAAPALGRGDALWLASSRERFWLQPDSFVPRVEFHDDFPPERKVEIRAETLSVVTWFAERYGLLEPNFELHVGSDSDSLDEARREVLGIQDPGYVLCGRAVNELVFIADWCSTATHDLGHPLAHEYFHVLQSHLVARTPTTDATFVADWLLEGTAEYAAIGYSIAKGYTTAEEVEQTFLQTATYNRRALSDLEANISQFDTSGYLLAAFAVQLLVGSDGTRAISEFFRLLPARSSWQDAFATLFERSPEAFYQEVSDYVATSVPELRTVQFTVLGPDGQQLHEWAGYPLSLHPSSGPSVWMDETGGTLMLPDGAYYLSAAAACVVRGSTLRSMLLVTIAWYTSSDDPRDGDPRFHGGQPDLIVDGEDLTLVIHLAGWPSELNINCYDGPRFKITGTVAGEGGEPRAGYQVLPYPNTGTPVTTFLDGIFTDETGAFTVDAPDGYSYRLTIVDRCGTFLGSYREESGFVSSDARDYHAWSTRIPVSGADVSGIEVVIPSSVETAGCGPP